MLRLLVWVRLGYDLMRLVMIGWWLVITDRLGLILVGEVFVGGVCGLWLVLWWSADDALTYWG